MKWFVVYSIIFVGTLPAMITSATTDKFLSLFDISALFLGWIVAFTILDLWTQYEVAKEIERKMK